LKVTTAGEAVHSWYFKGEICIYLIAFRYGSSPNFSFI